ncbi:hypothetical protein BP5796_12927 [Coleophoma crateriformis]|uniref:Rhodopsin domain-containing protein n=1 Tax=Coleophoma crateriformis TaxID=565419 RepID=A0A3D8Q5B7_9HELO|nr:hypothetical protein BP5796_12927 [Coleophoma crateriformis]
MSAIDLTENRQPELRATNIAILLLAVVFVALRFTSRWMKGFGIGKDDVTMIIALIFLFGAFADCMLGIHFGLGRHAAALTTPEIISYAKTLMAFECLYVTCICFTKISLLLMYCRIFPIRQMKLGAYILGSLSVGWCISIIMVSVFQCTPIAKTWNPTLPGHCINLKGSFIGNAIPNILTDAAILALPMPQVWHLHTSVLQKCQLSFVFLLGSFVIFTSIYRFTTLFQFQSSDVTWTLATAETWCVVESASGIISACLPTLGPLVQLATRSLGISTGGRSEQTPSAGTNLQTIGGSNSKNLSKNVSSGNFDDSKKSKGSRPFQRLNGEQQQWSQTSGKMTSSVAGFDKRDAESVDSDEVPLHVIRIKTDLEWSHSGKRTPEPSVY